MLRARLFFAAAAFAVAGIFAMPAGAAPFLVDGTCPAVDLNTLGCGTVITLGASGSASTVNNFHGQGPYEGSEDTLVGVINNSGQTINQIGLTGSNIFGFEGDGVCSLISCGGSFSGKFDASGYAGIGSGGQTETFTITDSNNGIVNFAGGLLDGQTAWFSLEEDLSAASFQITTVNNNPVTSAVPEPMTLALLGVGVFGLGAARRRR